MTAIVDLFPQHLRRGYRKEMFTAFVCMIWFLIGLSMVTEVFCHLSMSYAYNLNSAVHSSNNCTC